MKHPAIRPVHKKKEQTTNYASDAHVAFCKRCIALYGTMFCPRDRHGRVDFKGRSL